MLLQLSGVPGAGKSTLARAIAQATGLVVLDTDVVKSSLIASGVSVSTAGSATYAAALALAEDLLQQGKGVILDSPCRYLQLLDAGARIANEAGFRYGLIELWVRDWSVVMTRLDSRVPEVSQVASSSAPVPGTSWEFGAAEATLMAWQEQLVHPEVDWLRLHAEAPTKDNLAEALQYLADA